MKHPGLNFALLLAAFVFGACAQSRPRADGVSSETHFLRSCSDDSCGKDLSCVCGACTKPCDAISACTALAKDAVCLAAADDACDEGRTCDVQCKATADCAPLGDAFACTDGRCRTQAAPSKPRENDSGPSGGDSAIADSGIASPSCQLDAVADSLSALPMTDCGTLPLSPSSAERSAALDCLRGAFDGRAPFRLFWSESGTDSTWDEGLVGLLQGGALVVHHMRHDGGGWASDPEAPASHWFPCATFSVHEDCSDVFHTCFQCEARTAQQCICYEPTASGASASITCRGAGSDPAAAIDPPPCAADACELDGVCYPDQTTTEDGCCSCNKGMADCNEPGWCPGWVLIGKRCSDDADCSLTSSSSGLHCRTDFFGERGVCTRDCNFGCPTGTECVADVPDYNEGTIHNVCMRPCGAPADCDLEVQGSALGGECDAPDGLGKSYCF